MADQVLNDEELYRRVVFDPLCYTMESGILTVARKAFSDPKNQPSVDRANLCGHDPRQTQAGDSRNGVILLLTEQVRDVDINSSESSSTIRYNIDVVAVPLEENIAHAEIRADPQITSSKVFQRLRTRLAILANQEILANQGRWLIFPYDHRDILSP